MFPKTNFRRNLRMKPWSNYWWNSNANPKLTPGEPRRGTSGEFSEATAEVGYETYTKTPKNLLLGFLTSFLRYILSGFLRAVQGVSTKVHPKTSAKLFGSTSRIFPTCFQSSFMFLKKFLLEVSGMAFQQFVPKI